LPVTQDGEDILPPNALIVKDWPGGETDDGAFVGRGLFFFRTDAERRIARPLYPGEMVDVRLLGLHRSGFVRYEQDGTFIFPVKTIDERLKTVADGAKMIGARLPEIALVVLAGVFVLVMIVVGLVVTVSGSSTSSQTTKGPVLDEEPVTERAVTTLEGRQVQLGLDELIRTLGPPAIDLDRTTYKGPVQELWRRPARKAMGEQSALSRQVCEDLARRYDLFYSTVTRHHKAVGEVDECKYQIWRREYDRRWLQREEDVHEIEALVREEEAKHALDERRRPKVKAPEKSAEERRAESRTHRIDDLIEDFKDEYDLRQKVAALKVLYPGFEDEINRWMNDVLFEFRERRAREKRSSR
jgi:hypothetical protein